MYKFIDVNEASEGVVLPSEAMSINGEYIENLIPGYRTLSVQGREALSPVIDEYESGVRDGSLINSRRYPARLIIVKYQLISKSNEEFREAYNKLGGILNVDDAQLIFNDEPDKYFTGTPYAISEVEPGSNSVVSEFQILCNDPFKYSVTEYEAAVAEGEDSVVFQYNGTHKCYPKLEAEFYKENEIDSDLTGAGDCGYVAFFNENENIIQLGDPAEADGDASAYPASQTLMNQLFTGSEAWEGAVAKNLWAVNSGNIMSENVVQMGAVDMGYASRTTTVAVSNSSNTTQTTNTGGVLRSGIAISASGKTNRYTINYQAMNRAKESVYLLLTIKTYPEKDTTQDQGYTMELFFKSGGMRIPLTLKSFGTKWVKGTGTYIQSVGVQVPVSSVQTSYTSLQVTVTKTNRGAGSSIDFDKTALGIKFPAYASTASTGHNTSGTTYVTTGETTYYLTPTQYGTRADMWHGPSITREIGADESGDVGAKNFVLTFKNKMSVGNSSTAVRQLGAFQVWITDADGNNIAGIRIHKNLSGKSASLLMYVGGEKVYGTIIDLSYANTPFLSNASSVPSSSITKSGSSVLFQIAGLKQQFTSDAISDAVSTSVTFMFEKYSDVDALSFNGLYWAKLVKVNCNTYKDSPNKFSANDVLVADCKSAMVYLNGIPSPDLGALGNKWEAFYLRPGVNQVGVAHSEWVKDEYKPTFKVKYREVFL